MLFRNCVKRKLGVFIYDFCWSNFIWDDIFLWFDVWKFSIMWYIFSEVNCYSDITLPDEVCLDKSRDEYLLGIIDFDVKIVHSLNEKSSLHRILIIKTDCLIFQESNHKRASDKSKNPHRDLCIVSQTVRRYTKPHSTQITRTKFPTRKPRTTNVNESKTHNPKRINNTHPQTTKSPTRRLACPPNLALF